MLRTGLRVSWESKGFGRMCCPRSAVEWSRQIRGGGAHRGGERLPAVAPAARARSLPGQRPARRLGAMARQRVRELARWVVGAARARGARTTGQQGGAGLASAGKAAAGRAGEASRGSRVAHAAAGQGRSKEERGATSGRRQRETRGRAAEEGSEREWGSPGDASTIGKGTSARRAEGRASASTIGEGASARNAEGRASASTLGKGASARSAEGRASASTLG